MRNVSYLKASVAGLVSGVNLNDVTNLYGAIERAARKVVQKAAPPEASGRQNYMLYNGVYDYPAPASIFGGSFFDLRPQGVVRAPIDYPYKKPILAFDMTKALASDGCEVTFEYRVGVPIMRVAQARAQAKVTLDLMDETDGWTASGSASGLAQDTTVFYQEPASLRFTLTGSSAGILTKTLDNSLDLETYEDVGVAFLAIRIPEANTAAQLTSIEVKVGSSSANYNNVSDTEGFLGAWTVGNWLLVAFDFAGASQTGTPDWTAIDYLQVTINHTATMTNFRVGGLFMCLPSAYELLFGSAAVFSASGTPSTSITGDGDNILFSDAAFTLLEYETAIEVILQSGGSIAAGQGQQYHNVINVGTPTEPSLYARYRGDNPSAQIRQVGSWY